MKSTNAIQYFGEKWKNVNFDFEYSNDYRLEVSNMGRIRSFNKISDGNILKGSITEGYKIIRLKFFKAPDPATVKQMTRLQKKIAALYSNIKELKLNGEPQELIQPLQDELKEIKKHYSLQLALNTKNRTIHYHSLIHRLVAHYFLPVPAPGKTLVAHLDFNKLNNEVKNLKWMTPEENQKHQLISPFVLEEKRRRAEEGTYTSTTTKLTVTKVMLLKKLLNEGRKTVKQLSKQFRVSDMQIIRIRRGENWKDIPSG
ncbi:MAG: NUMOD4 domain-containing protein [Ferruginibacter sp.]